MSKPTSLVVCGLLFAGCAPIENSSVPASSDRGIGRVVTVADITGSTGESISTRIAVGLLNGPVGLALAAGTEGGLGTSKLYQYEIKMTDGSDLSVDSFSIVVPKDCVKVSTVGAKAQVILERTDTNACQTIG